MIELRKDGIPNIRFEGHDEPWEYSRLGTNLTERNIQHPQTEDAPLVSFTVEKGVTPKTERYDREQLVKGNTETKKYKETRLNDIVYNPANLKFGAIGRNKLGKAVFSPIYVTFDVNPESAKSEFIEMLVKRDKFIKEALSFQQGTVYERMSVSPEDLLNLSVYLPSLKEQHKTGSFLEKLDETITLQESKVEDLKDIKSHLLSLMFCSEGKSYPVVRFSGYTDPWEQRKFGDLTSQTAEYVNPIEQKIELWSLTASEGLVPKPERFNRSAITKKEDRYKILYPKQIAFNPMNMTIGSIGINKSLDPIAVSGYYVTLDVKADIEEFFFESLISSPSLLRKYKDFATGSLIEKQRVQYPTFAKIPVCIPSTREQQAIGYFLKTIDDTITLHQREIDILTKLKKGLLQQMFV